MQPRWSALAIGLALWAGAASADAIDDQLAALADAGTAPKAMTALVEAGSDAVPRLAVMAARGAQTTARGRAILCLGRIGGREAAAHLRAIVMDGEQSGLVRTWSAASLFRTARDGDQLCAHAGMLGLSKALVRPFAKRMSEVPFGLAAALEMLVTGSWQRLPQVTALPAPPVNNNMGGRGWIPQPMSNVRGNLNLAIAQAASKAPEGLVHPLLHGSSNTIRQQAAAFLGAHAGRPAVGRALLKVLRFEQADHVPWAGGALFLPQLNDRALALELTGELAAWLVYCERNRKAQPARQLSNNLNGSLMQAAGLRGVLGRRGSIGERYLAAVGQKRGRAALADLISRLGVDAESAPFKTMLADAPAEPKE